MADAIGDSDLPLSDKSSRHKFSVTNDRSSPGMPIKKVELNLRQWQPPLASLP